MSIIGSNILAGASGQAGYNINNSLRLRKTNSAYLSRTPATNGNRITWTYSVWLKRGSLADYHHLLAAGTGTQDQLLLDVNNTLIYYEGTTAYRADTVAVLRDPAAWYHIVVVRDATQATSTNRIKIYINGVQQTSLANTSYPALNSSSKFNNNEIQTIGVAGVVQYLDGYLADVNFVDGTALTPSSFGETSATTGSWIPKKYTGSYGTNGFFLNFSDTTALTTTSNAGLGKDTSGNGNYWATNGISITSGVTYDAMIDVPTNTSATVANYCVWNPLNYRISAATTFSNANLTSTFAGGGYATAYGTIAVTSGKYYWEVTVSTVGGDSQIGISEAVSIDSTSAVYRVYRSSGQKQTTGNVSSAYGSSYTTSDIIGVALDIDSGTITFYKNNTSQGTAFTDIASALPSTGWTPYGYGYSGNVLSANFGQRPFSYTPPTGYVALNTYNLPTPTILQGNKYMDATLWTGAGASTMTITNTAGFKPDMVWVKSRSNAYSNLVFNSIVGVGNTTMLITNTTDAEGAYYGNANLTSFNSNGFSTGATSGTNVLNANGVTNVAWQWQAGQGSTSSNTSGSITSTVSVNATAGFSVVTYTGTGANATVGHGLGVAPSMIIAKSRSVVADWNVYHTSLGATKALFLNRTIAADTNIAYWNNTSPTSSVFSLGYGGDVNTNASTNVAYCWAEIAGFSKFTSYTGNGSTDGPFIYTGFRPKWIMIKITNTTGSWYVEDTSRDTYNLAQTFLNPNTSSAEAVSSSAGIDFLSNGFKLRTSNADFNGSANTYIVMAYAENPFKNSNAR